MTPMEAALGYIAHGWAVFPTDTEKKPITEHGFKDATTNPEKVKQWFSRRDANVAIATGTVSGLVVVDLDEKGGKHGIKEFEKLIQNHPPVITRIIETPTGGRHLYFKYTDAINGRGDHPAPGIDFKADGGYVIAPPSVLKDGTFYKVVQDAEPAEAPDWLIDIMKKPVVAPPFQVPETIGESRNVTLTSLAGSLRRKGSSEAEILAHLKVTNQTRCNPPLPEDEVTRIARSVARYPTEDAGGAVITDPSGNQYQIKALGKTQRKDGLDPEKSYFIKGGSIYLTCRDHSDKYFFCHSATGKPVFLENAEGYVPRKVPFRDGVPVDVVGIPEKEQLETAPVLPAADLYQKLETHIYHYLDAPAIDGEMFIYYLLFTWYFPKVNTTPYLRFIADTGNGKSRMQRVIGDLCFYPIKAGGSSTPAGIMRLKEKWNGTLLIDEADLRSSDSTNELIKYLNLGFEKGQYFIKSDKDNPKEQDILDPFGPKIIGMRQPFNDNATEGRCLSFTPKETTRTDIPFILPTSYDNEVAVLRGLIARFVLANWDKVDGERTIDIQHLQIEPRLKQMALPLSIVLQLFPDGEERFRQYLTARQQELKRIRASSLEGMVFNGVLDWVEEQPDKKGHMIAKDLFERCGQKSANAVTRVLHSIGFKSEVIREGKTARVLVVPDAATWTNITQRYFFSNDPKVTAPECPSQLRSSGWVTLVTQVTLCGDAALPVKYNNTTTEDTCQSS